MIKKYVLISHPISMTNITGNIYGVVAIIMWSLSALLISYTDGIPPMLTACLAYCVGSLFYITKILIQQNVSRHLFRQPLKVYLTLIGGLGVYYISYFSALKIYPVIEANLINYLWPLLLIIMQAFYGEKKVSTASKIGIVFGFIGAITLLTDGRINLNNLVSNGYSLAFIAAISAAFYSKKLITLDFDRDFFAIVFPCIAMIMIILHLGFNEMSANYTIINLSAILFLGVATFATTLWSYGMRYGSADYLANMAYLIPLFSTALLIIFGRGQMTFGTWMGGGLILIGVTLPMIGQMNIWKKWRTR